MSEAVSLASADSRFIVVVVFLLLLLLSGFLQMPLSYLGCAGMPQEKFTALQSGQFLFSTKMLAVCQVPSK